MILLLTSDQVIRLLRERRDHLHNEFGVSRIGVFGSTVRGEAHDSSDVDIVVEFDRPIGFRFIELAEYIESLLGRNVDLLTPAGIQAIRSGKVAGRILETIVYV